MVLNMLAKVRAIPRITGRRPGFVSRFTTTTRVATFSGPRFLAGLIADGAAGGADRAVVEPRVDLDLARDQVEHVAGGGDLEGFAQAREEARGQLPARHGRP